MKVKNENIRFLLQELALNDSETAFKTLYFSYGDRIMRYIFLYVKSNLVAEELSSDVFLTVWNNRKLLPEIENFDAYIYRIAKFKALNYLRDEKNIYLDMEELPIDLFANTETTPEDDYLSKELIDTVNQAVEQLPTRCKLAFKLVREDKMKYKDAAEHLGISVKTLEAHLTAAMKKIKATIKGFML